MSLIIHLRQVEIGTDRWKQTCMEIDDEIVEIAYD